MVLAMCEKRAACGGISIESQVLGEFWVGFRKYIAWDEESAEKKEMFMPVRRLLCAIWNSLCTL